MEKEKLFELLNQLDLATIDELINVAKKRKRAQRINSDFAQLREHVFNVFTTNNAILSRVEKSLNTHDRVRVTVEFTRDNPNMPMISVTAPRPRNANTSGKRSYVYNVVVFKPDGTPVAWNNVSADDAKAKLARFARERGVDETKISTWLKRGVAYTARALGGTAKRITIEN